MRYLLTVLLFTSSALAAPDGYRFRIATEEGKIVVTECAKVPDFETYLRKLNDIVKPHNRICLHTNDATTTSHTIECMVFGGPSEAFMYWNETKNECEELRKVMRGGK